MLRLLTLAAEEEGGHASEPEGIDLILPAVDELVWGTICFAVVLFVLTRVAFPKIREAVEKREQTIAASLKEAEDAKTSAKTELEQYRKQLADARGEANKIIEEARQQAEQVRKDVTAKAEEEAKQITQRATEQLEAERKRTIQELQQTVASMSVQLAETIVGRSLDAKAHSDLVESYISGVAAGGNGSSKGGTSS